MERINSTPERESADAAAEGVERILRLQNVATQLQLLNTRNSRRRHSEKQEQEEATAENDD